MAAGGAFGVEFLTPSGRVVRRVTALRLRDASGRFTVLRGHGRMMTVLEPSIGSYVEESGREMYVAVEGGLLTVHEGPGEEGEGVEVTVCTRGLYEGPRPDELERIIEKATAEREKAEAAIARMLEGIERAFMQRAANMERGRTAWKQ
jgi:F0F1-type ATP synthase epsilon subunit